mmetsp:Transcript_64158/g.184284  ORF Transcript_64158/g.184284 Transcript_64158/m.184284 type:complete len:166 (+) Transcript_64158:48-545(+)|eukprot:CAMPEP_0177303708 /NCGR_PEP_ID=MMETSP0368-20130122/6275_1 /TAXON_ID=447022 ORGANISM="Scrippsiella hangoei-like, Strain SHHI-4" /NCGR_SAMPLE_ID=MMETSP0368 /ASSEMBLY_ACC=CAM_ASM_000363 /LENGTH=165 /DNA_ID=CAMNT_0018762269 /DNA_START=31 /DNA_END=528 /DNA_ORIENTATION=+
MAQPLRETPGSPSWESEGTSEHSAASWCWEGEFPISLDILTEFPSEPTRAHSYIALATQREAILSERPAACKGSTRPVAERNLAFMHIERREAWAEPAEAEPMSQEQIDALFDEVDQFHEKEGEDADRRLFVNSHDPEIEETDALFLDIDRLSGRSKERIMERGR